MRSQTLRRSQRTAPEQSPGRRSPRRRQSTREAARVLLREYHEHGTSRSRAAHPAVHAARQEPRPASQRGGRALRGPRPGRLHRADQGGRPLRPRRRVEFGAFVIPNVAGEIKRYLRDRASRCGFRAACRSSAPGLRACSAELSAQLARPATISEIADRLASRSQKSMPRSMRSASSRRSPSRSRLPTRKTMPIADLEYSTAATSAASSARCLPQAFGCSASASGGCSTCGSSRPEPASDRRVRSASRDPCLAADPSCAAEAEGRDRADAVPRSAKP